MILMNNVLAVGTIPKYKQYVFLMYIKHSYCSINLILKFENLQLNKWKTAFKFKISINKYIGIEMYLCYFCKNSYFWGNPQKGFTVEEKWKTDFKFKISIKTYIKINTYLHYFHKNPYFWRNSQIQGFSVEEMKN